MGAGSIAQVLREGYDVTLLAEGISSVGEELALDTQLPAGVDNDDLARQVEKAYDVVLAGTLPHSDEPMMLGSGAVFCHTPPQSEWSLQVEGVATALTGDAPAVA